MKKILVIDINNGFNPEIKRELGKEFTLSINSKVSNLDLFQTVVISPGFKYSPERSIKSLFICLKELYPLVVKKRGINIWITEPVIPDTVSAIEKSCFVEGIKNITKLVALELSGRSVSVNFLNKNNNGFNGLKELFTWSNNRKKIFLTAQIIN